MICILRISQDFKNIKYFKIPFNSLVRSILEYNFVVWNSFPENLKYEIKKFQNRLVLSNLKLLF